MDTASLLDEKHMVNAIVRIGGKKVNIVYLTLEQEYGQHHHFEIGLDYDITGNSFMDDPVEQIELIGRLAIINIRHGNESSGSYSFTGVITEIRKTGKEGKHGYLVVKGSSPTIILERGRRMDVYSDMTLRTIFKKVIDGVYSDYMKCVDEPTFDNKIDFLMQYNETDWEFLQRIAYLYGENLFYSGSEIIFGAYKEWEAVRMTYDKEITDIQFCSRMLPNESIHYQYVADQDMILEKLSPDKIENSNTYLDKTAAQNKALTADKPAKNLIGTAITSRSEMDELVKRDKTRTAAHTVYITGCAKSFESTLGRLIKVSMPDGMSNKKELGTYRVIKCIHRIDENHRYTNEFEAVPASLQTMPVAEPKKPVADSILAKVTSNEDPKGQGRVQVDFTFANQHSKVWMRVMTPGAGSSETVAKNRGLVFIPEKDDQVMIGFEYGDPNRPYVMGSMFHGNNAEGGGENNHLKSITTRSGSTLTFSDTEDEETYSILLRYNEQNSISIKVIKDEGTITVESTKDIYLKAPELIQMEAKQIVMKAEIIQATAEDKIELVAQNMLHAESANTLEVISSTTAIETEGEYTNKSDTSAFKASSKLDVDGGGKINMKAGDIKMNQ